MRWHRRECREQDLERELRSHLELEAEEQRESGLSPEEARYAARRAFGNIALTKEEVRHAWGWTRWETLLQDFRYALRTLRKSPGFAATAILTFALGIGASTAMFTIVDSVVLKPLSYRDSGRLVVAWERVRFLGNDPTGPNPRHVDLWQKRTTVFDGLTLARNMARGLSVGTDHPRPIGVVACLPNLFDVLQAPAVIGRTFLPEDGTKGHDDVAVLTYSFWQRLFQGDPGVIGKTIRIDEIPRRVIGVLPAGFHFPNANTLRSFRALQTRIGLPEPAVFFPVVLDPDQIAWNGDYGNWVALGRLKPGASIREAEAQLNAVQAQVQQEMPAGQRDERPGALGASVQPMQEAMVGEARTGLWFLMVAVGGLLLIACLNLANAQLGRTLARSREAAVRTALGAPAWRLVSNALAENLLLAGAGAAGGVLLAAAGLGLFRRQSLVDLPRLAEVHLNITVLLFAVVLACAASLLTGLAPALRMRAADPQAALQEESGRAPGGKHNNRLRAWLIGFQVFGCTVLLLLTGLFSKSLLHLLRQDRGFETEHVTIAEAWLPKTPFGEAQKRAAFDDAVLENLRAIPGVEFAGLVSAMPLEGEAWIESLRRTDMRNQKTPLVNARWVSPGYFETTRQRLVAGRFFEERDRNLDSVVLSEGEARALWGTGNPIGGEVQFLGRPHTVIGVVADSRSTSLKTAPARIAYVHYRYRTPYTSIFVARGEHAGDQLVSGMRQAIWKGAPEAVIGRVKTLNSQLADSLAPERFQTLVLTAFGTAALLLAMLGIYGVLSYSVATRRHEIGVRMALGATRSRIYARVFADAGVPVTAGLAAGIVAGALAGRAVQKLLFGVQAVEPAVVLIVTGLFLLSAIVAALLPARRAAQTDPIAALKLLF